MKTETSPLLDEWEVQSEGTMKHKGPEELIWTDDEEDEISIKAKGPSRKSRGDRTIERRWCSSCKREKPAADFGEERKTCRDCLKTQRLRRERVSGLPSLKFKSSVLQDRNSSRDTRPILDRNHPHRSRPGLRSEEPIDIRSLSESDEETVPKSKAVIPCLGCRKRHNKCTHGINSELAIQSGKPSDGIPFRKEPSLIVQVKLPGTESEKSMAEWRIVPLNEINTLDEELEDVARTAKITVLKKKLEDAEMSARTARMALAQTQSLKRANMRVTEELCDQESKDSGDLLRAQSRINELKQRLMNEVL